MSKAESSVGLKSTEEYQIEAVLEAIGTLDPKTNEDLEKARLAMITGTERATAEMNAAEKAAQEKGFSEGWRMFHGSGSLNYYFSPAGEKHTTLTNAKEADEGWSQERVLFHALSFLNDMNDTNDTKEKNDTKETKDMKDMKDITEVISTTINIDETEKEHSIKHHKKTKATIKSMKKTTATLRSRRKRKRKAPTVFQAGPASSSKLGDE